MILHPRFFSCRQFKTLSINKLFLSTKIPAGRLRTSTPHFLDSLHFQFSSLSASIPISSFPLPYQPHCPPSPIRRPTCIFFFSHVSSPLLLPFFCSPSAFSSTSHFTPLPAPIYPPLSIYQPSSLLSYSPHHPHVPPFLVHSIPPPLSSSTLPLRPAHSTQLRFLIIHFLST